MSYRYLAVTLLALVVFSTFLAGCTSIRLSDTHNTTVALQNYNTWGNTQKTYAAQAKAAIAQIGGHISEYNSNIATGSPDPATLRANVAADSQVLQQWSNSEASLDSATDAFDSATSPLDYHSDATKQAVGLLAQDMRIYAVDMKNTQQHLVEYTNYMNAYLAPDDPNYWNDANRVSAMNANADAIKSMADADQDLAAVVSAAKKLESSQ